MEGNKYILNRLNQVEKPNNIEAFEVPTYSNDGGIMLCTSGSCVVKLNARNYKIDQWGMVAVSPYTIIQLIDRSADFDCAILGVNIEFFSFINITDKGDYFLNINNNPSISLTEDEAAEILSLKDLLLKEESNESQLFYDEIHTSILKIITYKIFAFFAGREPNREISQSRTSKIFSEFVYELLRNHKKERKLDFYALKLMITPSHLSRCVKNFAGKNASDMIIELVINNIKYELSESVKSITEISDEFNFSNSSSFSQYFKKYTSHTPREYRSMMENSKKK